MNWAHNGFVVSTDKGLLQIDRIHKFLSTEAYWALEKPKSVIEKAIANSLCFGLFAPMGEQVGFARVVTDSATFAWICDVYVEKEFRGQGLSKFLMQSLMSHPDLKNLRRILLASRDAHGLYSKLGFQATQTPNFWMEIKDNES